jgi:hypothetical protein
MTKKTSKSPVMEWQSGKLELGSISYDDWKERWQWETATGLYLHTFSREAFEIGGFVGSSNGLFDGRPAMAHVTRPLRKGQPAEVACFVEFPSHYVTNVVDTRCRAVVDSAPDAFDPAKPILCGFDDYDVVVLPVRPTDQVWVGAVYRLRTEEVGAGADPTNPTDRAVIRRSILANQAIQDRFVVDPMGHLDDATCYALVSADGDSSLSVTGCAFTGLVATPSPEVSDSLLREMQQRSGANRSAP